MVSRRGRMACSQSRWQHHSESLGPGTGEDNGESQPENFQIQPDRPIVDVFEVEPDPIAEIGNLVAAPDLPQAGEARFHAQTAAMSQVVKASDFIHRQRAWSDQAHFTAQDVVELRK